MAISKTELAQAVLDRQEELAITESAAAKMCGASQQTFSAWKRGSIPRPLTRAALAEFLGISKDEMKRLITAAEASAASEKLPRLGSFSTSSEYGRMVDRKDGKYKFDTSRKAVPEGRYAISIDTKVMEPRLRVGTKAWIDPSVFARPGDEVVVHVNGGFSWIGVLESYETGHAMISRPDGSKKELTNVAAVHTIVLAERI
jgi:transcriptional regulator with XRE-family HTH domain